MLANPNPNARRIKLQCTNQARRNILLASLNTIARNDSSSREDEVRAERLNDRSRKTSQPI